MWIAMFNFVLNVYSQQRLKNAFGIVLLVFKQVNAFLVINVGTKSSEWSVNNVKIGTMNQCTREKEQTKPTDSLRFFFCLGPIMLANVFSNGAVLKMTYF